MIMTENTEAEKKPRKRKPRIPVAGSWIVQRRTKIGAADGGVTGEYAWIDLLALGGKREGERWLKDNGVKGETYRMGTAGKPCGVEPKTTNTLVEIQ